MYFFFFFCPFTVQHSFIVALESFLQVSVLRKRASWLTKWLFFAENNLGGSKRIIVKFLKWSNL